MVKKVIFFSACFSLSIFLEGADYSVILERDIFSPLKEKDRSELSEITETKVLPIEKLPGLQEIVGYRGVFYSPGSPSESYAVIENKKAGETEFLRAGETVNGARLVAVGENRVVFEYGYQELELTEMGVSFPRIYADGEYRVNLGELLSGIKELASEHSAISAEPYLENGSIAGFVITGIPESSPLKRLGIRNYDVVTRINTVYMDGEDRPLYAYENIMKYGVRRVVVELSRNNLPYVFLYRLE